VETALNNLLPLVKDACQAYKEFAPRSLADNRMIDLKLDHLNTILHRDQSSEIKDQDLRVVEDLLFEFLPKLTSNLSEDITYLMSFGLELRAKAEASVLDEFQDSLNHNADMVQRIGKAATLLHRDKGHIDIFHNTSGEVNHGRERQDTKVMDGKFSLFCPAEELPKKLLSSEAIKKSLAKLTSSFTKLDSKDIQEMVDFARAKITNPKNQEERDKIRKFLIEDFNTIILESFKRSDAVFKYLLEIKNILSYQLENVLRTRINRGTLSIYGAYAYRLFTDPRKFGLTREMQH
jgi:hypothetical protein